MSPGFDLRINDYVVLRSDFCHVAMEHIEIIDGSFITFVPALKPAARTTSSFAG